MCFICFPSHDKKINRHRPWHSIESAVKQSHKSSAHLGEKIFWFSMKKHWNCFPSLCLGFFLQNFPCESFLRQKFAIVLRISCIINKNTFRSFKNKPRTRSKRFYNNSCSRLRAKSHKSEIEISFDLFSAFKLFTTFSCSAQNCSADDDEDVHNERLKSMICFLFMWLFCSQV